MKQPQTHARIILLLLCLAGIRQLITAPWITKASSTSQFAGPQSSQPLALSADDETLAVANPDNNTVSFFDIKHGRKVAEAASRRSRTKWL